MFHVKDGLFFKQKISASCPGYSYQEEIDKYFTIQVVVAEVDKATVVDEKGEVRDDFRQKVVFTTEFNVNALASVMASMSVRGETAETYQEALAFLKKREKEDE